MFVTLYRQYRKKEGRVASVFFLDQIIIQKGAAIFKDLMLLPN